jgi:1,4-alpha-glucan branching enzyme
MNSLSNEANDFESIIGGRHSDPGSLLGPNRNERPDADDMTTVRAFLPHADRAWIVSKNESTAQEMRLMSQQGLFEVVCGKALFDVESGKYKFRYTQGDTTMSVHDPYAFEPMLSDLDLHLFNEGNHYEIYNRLGAHFREIDGVKGVNFAVWAPNAKGISLFQA